MVKTVIYNKKKMNWIHCIWVIGALITLCGGQLSTDEGEPIKILSTY